MKTKKKISKFHFVSWMIFIIGVIFYSLHWRGGGITILVACLLMLVVNLISIFKNKWANFHETTLLFTITFVSIYICTRIMFLGFSNVILLLSLLTGALSIILLIVKKIKFSIYKILILVYFFCIFPLFLTPSYKIYYVLYRKVITNENNDKRIIRANVLDKYSWFLYSSDEFSEAEKVNEMAINEAMKYKENNNQLYTKFNSLERIEANGKSIKNRKWEDYSGNR
ncbi:MAG: hypothetical protein PF448_10070 [Bacteroidales bacterium]|jgi:hypothetical protein|nr:hypothetical protein [Bacteroidales bacterium]